MTIAIFIEALLQETDSLNVMPTQVAKYYASMNILSILPTELPFKMDAFGIITKQDHLLSPSADLMLKAIRVAAHEIYQDALLL